MIEVTIMKKITISAIFMALFVVLSSSISTFALTDEELDLYNHQYYPQSINNGGINQVSQDTSHDFYVNSTTGNATVRVTDLVLPGKNGFDLELTRSYNSFQSNLYEPYVVDVGQNVATKYYRVIGFKDFEKTNTVNEPIESGYNISICINSKYYNYTTDANKFYNILEFEFSNDDYTVEDLFENYSEAAALASELNNTSPDIYAVYPYSNIGLCWVDYKNFTVEEITVGVHSPEYETGLLNDTSLERYSKLGAGWEFDFPYIEKRYGDYDYEYLHYGDKGTWRIKSNVVAGQNNLIGYPLKDIMLSADTSVTHDGKRSQYCLTEKDGKKLFFGTDGRLLLMRDRYGNEIKFYHATERYPDTNGVRRNYPYLTGITDSVGRTITLTYGEEYTSLSKTFKNITVTVTDPTNSENNITLTYKLKKLTSTQAGGTNADKYFLERVKMPDGEDSSYNYNYMDAPVDFFNRNTSFVSTYSNSKNANTSSYINKDNIGELEGATNRYILLDSAHEADGREYRFYYGRFLKNCTHTGSMLFYKAYYMCDDVRFDENGTQYEVNEHNYKYFVNNNVEYDGYPNYRRTDSLPASFRITVEDIVGDKSGNPDKLVTNTYNYRYTGSGDSQTILLDNTTSKSVDFKTTTQYTHDDTTRLTTNILTREYNSPDATEYMEHNEAYVYDSNGYGDLVSYTPNQDTNRAINYTYNSAYHYLTQKTYKRDSNHTVVEEYVPTTDNKSVAQERIYENEALVKSVDYSYDSYGNIIQKKEYTGNQTEYIQTDYSFTDTQYNGQFTGANLMNQTVCNVSDNDGTPVNVTQSYEYDWRGNVTKVTDGNGNVTSYEYNDLNRLTKETCPDGTSNTFFYDYAGTLICKTDAIGNVYTSYYDGSGNLLEEAVDDWRYPTVVNWYDGYNNLAKKIVKSNSENGRTTQYTYDTLNRPKSQEIYDDNGTLVYKETYSYTMTPDYRKETTTVIGGDGNPSVTTSVYYDEYGNKIKTESGTDIETYTSDYAGNITSVKSARANAESWSETHTAEYDFMGNVTKETDELGNTTRTEYDQLGRATKVYDANGYATEFMYDNLGRVIEQRTPFEEKNGTVYYSTKQMWYDNNGNVIKERTYTNASGETESYNEVVYTYDNRNRLVMTQTNDGETSSYTQNYYDGVGNLLRVYTGLTAPLTINGLDDVETSTDTEYAVTKYSYDKFGQVLTVTDALGKVETNTYDTLNGILLSTTDRNGQTFNFSYDGMGNITEKALSDGTNTETTTYGLTGQVLTRQNGVTTISYTYNNKGQLATESDSSAGTTKTYTYDANGNRASFTLTRNGTTEINQSYAYDKLNRLISVSENGNVIAQYSYDNKGNRTQTVTSGGETTNYTYNLANMLVSQTTGEKLTEQYTYYLNGNQKSKTSNGETTTYEYDAMNRLVKENNTEYSFDDFGNRASMTSGADTVTYEYDLNNRLTESNEVSGGITKTTNYSYDNNGNQTIKTVMTTKPYSDQASKDYFISGTTNENIALYSYNCYNQLIEADTNGVVSNYSYAPDGLRHSKTVGENTTTFVYDNANIVEEIASDGTNKYYRGFEIIKNDDNLYYIYNGQGDVTILTDNTGTTVTNYSFDAYGNQSEENEVYNPFGYRGEYTDEETGFIYLRARYYDTETGRFVSEDPIRDGLNWYVYCNGNPIMFVDPSGNVPVDTIIDFFSLGWSLYDFINRPSLSNFGYVAWDAAAMLVPYVPGSYSGKMVRAGTKILSSADNYVKTGVWSMKAFDRGYEIERALGGWGNNFPTIDWAKRTVRSDIVYLESIKSIKSIDITAKSYQKASTLSNKLRGYVDDLLRFEGVKSWQGKRYKVVSGTSRTLEIAVPPVEMTPSQTNVFNEIIEYAAERGIKVDIKIVK